MITGRLLNQGAELNNFKNIGGIWRYNIETL